MSAHPRVERNVGLRRAPGRGVGPQHPRGGAARASGTRARLASQAVHFGATLPSTVWSKIKPFHLFGRQQDKKRGNLTIVQASCPRQEIAKSVPDCPRLRVGRLI